MQQSGDVPSVQVVVLIEQYDERSHVWQMSSVRNFPRSTPDGGALFMCIGLISQHSRLPYS